MLGGSASGSRSVGFCWVEFIPFSIPGPRLRDSNELAVGSSFDNDRDTKEQVETSTLALLPTYPWQVTRPSLKPEHSSMARRGHREGEQG